MLSRMAENVRLFALWMEGRYDYPSSSHFIIGDYFHTLVLEPHKLETKFLMADVATRNTKGYKEAVEEAGNRDVITRPEYHMAKNMVENIMAHDILREIIEESEHEVPAVNEVFGIKCKGKADMVWDVDGTRIIADLKSTSKTVQEFEKFAYIYGYHRQAAMYMELFNADEFWFIPSEKTFPYTPALYRYGRSSQFFKNGINRLEQDLSTYKRLFVDGEYNLDDLLIVEDI
jgi:hypothetical protein